MPMIVSQSGLMGLTGRFMNSPPSTYRVPLILMGGKITGMVHEANMRGTSSPSVNTSYSPVSKLDAMI